MKKIIMALIMIVTMCNYSVLFGNFSSKVYADSATVFSQTDSQWSDHPYGKRTNSNGQWVTATIGSSGCGILAYVNAIYYLTNNMIDPVTLADWSVSNGHRINDVGTACSLYKAFANTYGADYGFEYVGEVSSYAALRDYLNMGYVTTFHAPGHIMACVDYDPNDGTYLVLDSYKSSNRGTYSNGYTWKTESQMNSLIGSANRHFHIMKKSGNSNAELHYSNHTINYGYQLNFDAVALETFKPWDVNHNHQANRRIDAGDECYIHEVYSDGCCRVTYPSSSGPMTLYAHIWDFEATHTPNGCVDVVSGGEGVIGVRGWAFDPDNADASLAVWVYVGGPAGSAASADDGYEILADVYRPDVNKMYNSGNNHGFDKTIKVKKTGTQTIYIYCDNVPGGEPILLATETVTITTHQHTVVTDKAVAATCTTAGKTEGSHCSVCNTVIKAQTTVVAKGHTAVTDKAVAATCTTAGKTEGSHCSVCNTVIKAQTVIPAKGHTVVTDPAVPATTTITGLTEGSHCSVCRVVIKAQEVTSVLLSISSQPSSKTVTEGKVAKFTVVATGTDLTYQWQTSTDGSNWRNSGYVSATKATITFTSKASQNGSYYRCKVTDASGKTVTSNAVKLTVNSKLVITTQPSNCSVTEGKAAKFTVVAAGTGLTYQWQTSVDGTSWRNSGYASATKATITFTSKASQNGNFYRCKIKDASGNTVTTKAVLLAVKAKGATITTQPSNCIVTAGKAAKFVVVALGEGLTYQWQTSTDGSNWRNSGYASAVKDTLTFTSKSSQNGSFYRCIVKNSSGAELISDEVLLVVK